jgi:photosystem II stability/assembly factor-like uncharacterized protein
VGHPGLLLASQDQGGSFTRVAAGLSEEALFSIDFNAKGEGAIVGRSGLVLLTSDHGKSWQRTVFALGDEHPSLFSVDVLEDGAIVAVGEFGAIARTTDHGKTWEKSSFEITLPALPAEQAAECAVDPSVENENADVVQEARLTDVRFADAQHGYIVGEFGLVLRTEDGGKTFKRENSCTDKTLYGVSVPGPSRAIAVGAEGSVVETDDGGHRWQARKSGTSENLYGVWSDAQRTLAVGAAGAVLVRDGGGALAALKSGAHTWLTSAWLDPQGKGIVVGGRGSLLGTSDAGRTLTRKSGE